MRAEPVLETTWPVSGGCGRVAVCAGMGEAASAGSARKGVPAARSGEGQGGEGGQGTSSKGVLCAPLLAGCVCLRNRAPAKCISVAYKQVMPVMTAR